MKLFQSSKVNRVDHSEREQRDQISKFQYSGTAKGEGCSMHGPGIIDVSAAEHALVAEETLPMLSSTSTVQLSRLDAWQPMEQARGKAAW